MIRRFLIAGAACLALGSVLINAQIKPMPRPPAQVPGQPPPGESATPDGYQPIPLWMGQTHAPAAAKTETFTVETFAEGLNGAFSLHFLPDGRIIVSERGAGKLRIVGKDGKVSEPLAGMPAGSGARGTAFWEVQPDRKFSENRTLYLSYTVMPDGVNPATLRSPAVLQVASATLAADDKRLENVKVLLANAEGTGGRLAQLNDGTLVITTSIPAGLGIKSEEWMQPQQLDTLMGKVLRINADGSVPKDNPFVGKAGARPEIYALGIRDDQGIAVHPKTGRVWVSEHGPRGGDEINEIEKGKNYGFPIIGYGRDYTGKPINNDKTAQAGMEQPVYFWTPDIAPSGIAFYTGKMFPAWDGSLFVAGLASKNLTRLVLNGDRVVGEERLLADLNARIRGVTEGPDGALYVLTDGMGGKILRLKK
jgi:glucose/arabinose dehydrogenase